MTTWIKTKIFWANNTLSWKEPRYNRSHLVTTRKQSLFEHLLKPFGFFLFFFFKLSHFGDTSWVLTALHDFYSMIGQPLPAEALHILLSGLGHWLNWRMVLAILHQDVHRFNCELEVCNKDSRLCRLKICPAFISNHPYNFFGWKTCPLWCHRADSILTESSTSSVIHPRFCPFPNISISVLAEGWKSRLFLLGGYKQIAKHAVSWWSVVCWEANK